MAKRAFITTLLITLVCTPVMLFTSSCQADNNICPKMIGTIFVVKFFLFSCAISFISWCFVLRAKYIIKNVLLTIFITIACHTIIFGLFSFHINETTLLSYQTQTANYYLTTNMLIGISLLFALNYYSIYAIKHNRAEKIAAHNQQPAGQIHIPRSE